MGDGERMAHVDGHEAVVLVSEFGAWMRRMILVLLVVLTFLIVWLTVELHDLNQFNHRTATLRQLQVCAILKDHPLTPEVQVAIDETC